jgi:UMF1 family MFS transporter
MAPNLQPPRPPLHGKRHWSGLSILSRRSFTTSSFEADDERSSMDHDAMSSSPSSSTSPSDRRRQSAAAVAPYPGYDGRPTSRKETTGWYMYAFASETYVICGIGMPPLSRPLPDPTMSKLLTPGA